MVLKNLFTGQQWRNRLMDMAGEGEIYGESTTEIYITMCKIYSPRDFAVWLRKLKQGLCINPEGWAGREVHKGGGVCIPVANSCWHWTENSKILQSNYPLIKKKREVLSLNTGWSIWVERWRDRGCILYFPLDYNYHIW